MTKQGILDYFKDINEMYNDCTRLDSLSRMLDELLESIPQKPETPELIRCKDCKYHDEEDGKNFCDCGDRPDDWFCADWKMKEGRSRTADDTIPRFDDSIGRMPEL